MRPGSRIQSLASMIVSSALSGGSWPMEDMMSPWVVTVVGGRIWWPSKTLAFLMEI